MDARKTTSERTIGSTMWTRIGNILLVTLLTLLVWMWAEGESLTSGSAAPRVQVVPPPGGELAVRVDDPAWTGSLGLTMRGSTASIASTQRELLKGIKLSPGIGLVPSTPGSHVLRLWSVLREQPELQRQGVSISSVEPATLKIVVEETVEVSVPVQLRPVGVELAEEPVLKPSTVMVRVPASTASRLGVGVYAIAAVPSAAINELKIDGTATLTADLSLSRALLDAQAIGPSPTKVEVTIKRGKGVQTVNVPAVPVVVLVDSPTGAGWKAEVVDAFVRNVELRGPAAAMTDVREGRVQVRAVVVLTTADLKEGEIVRPVTIATGIPGVTTATAELMVRVRVTRAN